MAYGELVGGRFVMHRAWLGDPNRMVVLGVVAMAVSGLVACGDDADDDDVVDPDTLEEAEADAYVHPTGCISFVPAEDWEQVDETHLGVSYSADPENPYSDRSGPEPGEPGVLVTANCAPLDQVGAPGPVAVPGFDLVDGQVVDFGGGEGRMVEYQVERPGVPVQVSLQVDVDINDARCPLQVVGARDAVEAVRRGDADAAVASYRCTGR